MTEPTAGPAAAPEPVLLSERTAWGVRLTLNRPAKLNALSDELLDAVVDAVEAAGRDPDVRVVVLRGAGRAFCSGFDLAGRGRPDSKPRTGETQRRMRWQVNTS